MLRGTRTAIFGAVVVALCLVGCAADVRPQAKSNPTSEWRTPPRFGSRKEAIAAAEKAYRLYSAISDQISSELGERPERLRQVTTTSQYSEELQGINNVKEHGLHTTGRTRVVKFEAQSVDLRTGHVVAYTCIDLSAVRVRDAAGKNVTPSARPDRQTFVSAFAWSPRGMLLEENLSWSGRSIC